MYVPPKVPSHLGWDIQGGQLGSIIRFYVEMGIYFPSVNVPTPDGRSDREL